MNIQLTEEQRAIAVHFLEKLTFDECLKRANSIDEAYTIQGAMVALRRELEYIKS